MLKNYLKVTLRNLAKHKSFSFINIAGLSFGIACCLLITGYVLNELSYDKFHENSKNIYRIHANGEIAGAPMHFVSSSPLMAPMLLKDYPDVKTYVRLRRDGTERVSYEDKKLNVSDIYYSDPTFFDVFSFKLLKGVQGEALSEINTVVMTEETARNFFGDDEPIGKVIKYADITPMEVVGIVEEAPENSHFEYGMLISMETYKKDNDQFVESVGSWLSFNFHTYLLLEENSDPALLDAKMKEFIDGKFGEMMKNMGGYLFNYLMPLENIHLHSNFGSELGANSDIKYIYSFAAIALFILLIACINYMNLATAKAANRAKEVGMRKVLGALKSQLSGQFYMESLFYSMISVGIAVVLAELMLPLFNQLSGREIVLNYFNSPIMLGGLLGIALFIGLAAGSYPALLLSSFRPVLVLKGTMNQGAKSSTFRNVLVSLQFVISIVLMISTLVVYNQLTFMKNKNLGFEKEQILTFVLPDTESRENWKSIKEEMLNVAGVLNISATTTIPGGGQDNSGHWPEGVGKDQVFIIENFYADEDFVDTYTLEILEGRNFSSEMATDAAEAILVNETLVKNFGWQNPIGMTIKRPTSQNLDEFATFTVIGVFKDFHTQSLYSKIEPVLIANRPVNFRRYYTNMSVKIDMTNITDTVEKLESVWGEFIPDKPFYHSFLNEDFDSRYRAEEQLVKIFNAFSIFAILIACLGLFGLASFTAEQRTKEIGIRKALGSTSSGIVLMLCKEFVKLVVLANLIAWPIAFYAMNEWLTSFPYQAALSVLPFIYSATGAIIVALGTVSYQSFKAARTNPADSLHTM